ncbi:hypothetical protein PYH37_000454 [Sinorhizobium numidicum]|uniref:Uncharacterized protein n=1 Tax=Sinorhizobium numidicum TaxID=680248 RepID=A0ABY8CV10_9HYPH|nr:hypothetical protein [Sinorhizobium numidicum]WEX75760.1 hypothetical protein PYH37_000454 [Sinorhizobium numidicum]WEX81747.1 hypothetical protein PYH38_000456 [Sinorhizobium numidicum]
MWNAGGKLPNGDAKLARVARISVKKWKSIEGDLLGFFDVTGSDISHNRLTKELQKSERKSQSRADAGAKGGSAKALKDKEARLANARGLPRHSSDTRPEIYPPHFVRRRRRRLANGRAVFPSNWDFASGLGLNRPQALERRCQLCPFPICFCNVRNSGHCSRDREGSATASRIVKLRPCCLQVIQSSHSR